MFEKVLLGYAGEPAGHDAIALAARLARAAKASLTVVFPYHPLLARETSEQAQACIEAEVGERLAIFGGCERESSASVAELSPLDPGSAGPPAVVECLWSSSSWPIRALHELARYKGADLIVLGAAPATLGERLQPSLMERLVHGAPCAVAVAPAGYAASILANSGASSQGAGDTHRQPPRHGVALRRIGVGFASSPEGLTAARFACELAQREGGEVCLVAGAGLEPSLASYAFSSPALQEVEDEIYAETKLALARACEDLAVEYGVAIESDAVRGEPAGVLVERSSKLDLLVLGSRAYGPVRHVFLGSVSAQAMREARCPVLVVPRGVGGDDERLQERPRSAPRPA